MPQHYTITRTTPKTYIDQGGQPVSGYQVDFTLHKWNEGHSIDVPNMSTATVQPRIEQVMREREALDKLGV